MRSNIKHLVAMLLLASYCHATTVVVVITPQAIYVGADGKHTSGGPIAHSRPITKAVIFQKRLIVACLGICRMSLPSERTNKADVFDFTEWIGDVEKKAPANVSVSDLTSLLERESSVTFNDFKVEDFIGAGAFDGQRPQKNFVDFVVLGYDAGVPTVNRVKYEIDWSKRRLILRILNDHPRPDTGRDFDFFILGESVTLVNDVKNRESNTYKELVALVPNVVPKLAAMQPLSHDEATSLCLAVLKIQTKHLKNIGPPYSITITVPLGAGEATQVIFPK